jgi:topoisomerase-4 subunit B
MYIGKLGDGRAGDDGIYVLVKEIIDNAIDEHVMGHGKRIEITVTAESARIRDFGRGIPLGSVLDCVSKINTGAKYDSDAFQKSVGLNGVGTKAVNALSSQFRVASHRDGQVKAAVFSQGILQKDEKIAKTKEPDGTLVEFVPDDTIFKEYIYRPEFLEELIWNYAYLNPGLTLHFNGKDYRSEKGLFDLLMSKCEAGNLRYPIIHLRGPDIEIAFGHVDQYGEDYYSYVNGGYTPMGGTHLTAFREGLVRTVNEFYGKDYDPADIRTGMMGAVSVRIQEPIFESQTKTKLGSQTTKPDGPSLRAFVIDFLKKELDNFLHRHKAVAAELQAKIIENEKERKEMAGIRRLAGARAKKANLFNKKLRDCKVHNNTEHKHGAKSTIFITEGDSASGSLTKARDPEFQAVFSLRGKPLNTFSLSKKVVYENEEFNLLHNALNIEEGLEHLRYNRIVIATDADVDGMHIRLLLMTYFLQFFPELVRQGHVFVLQTPLFRVRNKEQTIYCYDETEKQKAVKQLKGNPEITRFKGLGEISPDEFEQFIGEKIHLEPVTLGIETKISKLLKYYMGKNTPERQEFIIKNLHIETLSPDPALALDPNATPAHVGV